MFPQYNKKKNHEIPSLDQIKKREGQQEVHKKASPDFFRKQIQDKSRKEGSQNEEERQKVASFGKRTELGDITNKDTSHKEVSDQSKRESSEKTSPDQTKEEKGQREELEKRNRSLERQRVLHNRAKDRSANEVGRTRQANLERIDQSIQSIRLQDLQKVSMTDHDMRNKGVDPEKFRRVSQELSNALEKGSPDQSRVPAARKEFIEMAKKLGLIGPEI